MARSKSDTEPLSCDMIQRGTILIWIVNKLTTLVHVFINHITLLGIHMQRVSNTPLLLKRQNRIDMKRPPYPSRGRWCMTLTTIILAAFSGRKSAKYADLFAHANCLARQYLIHHCLLQHMARLICIAPYLLYDDILPAKLLSHLHASVRSQCGTRRRRTVDAPPCINRIYPVMQSPQKCNFQTRIPIIQRFTVVLKK